MKEPLCPLTETFRDVEAMLQTIVQTFRNKCGVGTGDMLNGPDLMAEARRLYCEAYETYDRNRSKFSTHCWTVVWWGLMQLKDKACQPKRCPPNPIVQLSRFDKRGRNRDELKGQHDRPYALPLPDSFHFHIKEMLADASDDAGKVIRLVLELPTNTFQVKAPKRSRRRLVELLLEIGWTAERIVESFREITDLIS
jgi:hypothetical protein